LNLKFNQLSILWAAANMDIPDETIREIGKYITDLETYRSCVLTNTRWNRLITCRKLRRSLCNQLWSLIKRFPTKKWNYSNVHLNINTPFHRCINSAYVSGTDIAKNPNLTIGFVLDYPEYDWVNAKVFLHIRITIDEIRQILESHHGDTYIKNNNNNLRINWYDLSINGNIRVRDLVANDDLPWWWDKASSNKSLDIQAVIDGMKNADISWDWVLVSRNPGITIDDVINHPELPWDYHGLDGNPNFDAVPMSSVIIYDQTTPNFIQYLIKYGRDSIIEHARRYPGSYALRTLCILAPVSLVLNFHTIDWNGLSYNAGLTIETILKHQTMPWNWVVLSHHKNITMDMISKNRNLPWDFEHISRNPNLNMDFIVDNMNEWWDVSKIPSQTFGLA
jgi:hypothetical protein